ncbi:squalene/phytoene synthase family protein [Streptomyces sp. NPDC004539]|uniref:squalene/phytoene synthase family protein n=1 Tax=Streptomyces sp. NPDC004539 TaxID=3154280 RepID=UPI0033AA78F3
MSTWRRSLDAAGIREAGLRRDYSGRRRTVARFRRTAYIATRLLLPPSTLPHAVVATAFMHHADNLLDTGPKDERAAAWDAWERRVRNALRTGTSEDPLLRAMSHTVTVRPRMREAVETYLTTAVAELDFTGFTDEADYQTYVDAYVLPAFMLVATLVGPEDDDRAFRAACRTFIDGSQRLDFVNDLAEDLQEGRLGIPADTLERFCLTPEDIATNKYPDTARSLIEYETAAARTLLRQAAGLPHLAPPPFRPLLGALVRIELLTADAAMRRGTRLLRGPASPSPAGALRVLSNARRDRRTSR